MTPEKEPYEQVEDPKIFKSSTTTRVFEFLKNRKSLHPNKHPIKRKLEVVHKKEVTIRFLDASLLQSNSIHHLIFI
jgi:hypothetical protein